MIEEEIVLALVHGDLTDSEVRVKAGINQYRIDEIMRSNHCEICWCCQLWVKIDNLNDAGLCTSC